ncbi:MAG: hypothetical protein LBT37_02450 [Lactobacillaceae bacterium]|jgi:hypothetical protein|nr:hypothetical protein [Lactobacillaceae bacterium]
MTSNKKVLSLVLFSTLVFMEFGGGITSNVHADDNPVATDLTPDAPEWVTDVYPNYGYTGVRPISDTDLNAPLWFYVDGKPVKPVTDPQNWVYVNHKFVETKTGSGTTTPTKTTGSETNTPATQNQQGNPSTTTIQSVAPTIATPASGSTDATKQATDSKALLPATDATSNFEITALVLSATALIFGLFGYLLKRNQ